MKFIAFPFAKLRKCFTILFLVLGLFVFSGGVALSNSLPGKVPIEWLSGKTIEQRTHTTRARKIKCIPVGLNEITVSQFEKFKALVLFSQMSPQRYSAGLE
jgi:hypothetical protein